MSVCHRTLFLRSPQNFAKTVMAKKKRLSLKMNDRRSLQKIRRACEPSQDQAQAIQSSQVTIWKLWARPTYVFVCPELLLRSPSNFAKKHRNAQKKRPSLSANREAKRKKLSRASEPPDMSGNSEGDYSLARRAYNVTRPCRVRALPSGMTRSIPFSGCDRWWLLKSVMNAHFSGSTHPRLSEFVFRFSENPNRPGNRPQFRVMV